MLDPYAVLGLDRKATVAEIKAAYRALAKQWHPDRHRGEDGAREKFVEIGAAYRSLVGPDRHRKNARPAPAATKVKEPPPQPAEPAMPEERKADTDAVLERIFGGAAKRTRVDDPPRMDAVPEGALPEDGSEAARRQGSHARAVLTALNALFGRRARLQAEEAALAGGAQQMPVSLDLAVPLAVVLNGGSIDLETPDGKTVPIEIVAGIPDGTRLPVVVQPDAESDATPSEYTLTVRHATTGALRSEGADLHGELAVALDLAVLGGRVPFETLDGSIRLTIPAWSGSDRTLRVAERGLPKLDGGRGDLFVHLRVMLPDMPDPRLTDLMRTKREGFYV